MAMTDTVIVIAPGALDDVKADNPKLVVDCWADWCGPCRMLSPIIDKLAEDHSGKVAFGKLNVDENQAEVQRFKIMAIPTVLFFKDGEMVDQVVGVVPKEEIESVMRKHF